MTDVQNCAVTFVLSIKWKSTRLGGPAHGIVTKMVHEALPGGGGGLMGFKVWRI